jgi:tRNA-2-methylthio-N6-dimethylallyladenosine synthase
MNACDSDTLSSILLTYGALRVYNLLDADVVILNTCSVRTQSEQKAFSYIGRIEKFKRLNSNFKIIVIGCMAERLGYKIKKRFSSVDLVMGLNDINNIALKIINLCSTSDDDNSVKKIFDSKSSVISRYMIIIRGCNNYCSYCVVPFVRGIEKSIEYQLLIDKCYFMVENGVREITLLGQNVNSYRYKGINFSLLLKKIASIKNLSRIRFMTNHPKDLDDELINVVASEQKICHHIHLPMQSASNRILEVMNRKYTYEDYLNLVTKLRTVIPNVSITSDIIVGFPGETEKDFNDTLNAVKKIRFDGLYVFKYSPRPNTIAYKIPDIVTLEEKKRRHLIILNESNKISVEIVSKMIGSVQRVLAEKINDGIVESKTVGGRKVFFKGNKNHIGNTFNVIIKAVKINSLLGDII